MTLMGMGGDDIYVVSNAGTKIVEDENGGTDEVQTHLRWKLGSWIENLTLTGNGSVDGFGNELDNRLLGNSGANALYGDLGDDTLDGGGGDDTLDGGEGDDTLVGGAGSDRIIGGAGTDTAVFGGNYAEYEITRSGNDIIVSYLGGSERDVLSGIEMLKFADRVILAAAIGAAPAVTDDVATGFEDETLELAVLGNDSGQDLRIIAVTNGAKGNVTVNSDGTVTYAPVADEYGQDSFTYTVADANGQEAQATVTVTLEQVNDAPVATDDSFATSSGTVSGAVLDNDTDCESDGLTIAECDAQSANGGLVTMAADGSFTYTAPTGFNGDDTFSYAVSDGNGGTSTGTVTVAVSQSQPDETSQPAEPTAPGEPVDTSGLAANLAAAGGLDSVANPSLAFNLTSVTDYSVQMPFIDIMKMARTWLGHLPGQWGGMSYDQMVEAGVLDSDGWPKSIPDGLDSIGTIWAWGNQPDAAESRKGVYVLTYEGEGTLELANDAKILSQEAGRIVFENVNGGQISLKIKATDPAGTGEYIRDISIVREEHVELHEAGAMFNPEWTAVVGDAAQFRFMDWMRTNNSEVVDWADRAGLDDFTWAGSNGVPVEAMVQLANETSTDPWFTMPLHASADFIREFATYVRDNLDPHLTAHVEMSNETWNWGFQQTRDIGALAEAEWGATGGKAQASYYAKLATEGAIIWSEVFAGEADGRLVNVLGSQSVNPWHTEQILKAELWFQNEPGSAVAPGDVFDAVAVTTYFGSSTVSNVTMRDELIAVIKDPSVDPGAWLASKLMDPTYKQSIPQIADYLTSQKSVASQYGLDLLAYEGGQHVHHHAGTSGLTQTDMELLQAFLGDFVRSSYMADLYEELWNVWEAVGDGPFMQYGDLGSVNKWGSWALLNGLGDSTPRSDLLFTLNESTPAWWEDAGTAGTHANGVTRLGESTDDLLIGTAGRDYLIGSAGNDILVGGAGDDVLHGGEGYDILQLSGSIGEYQVLADGDGHRLTGPDGSDYLIGIEEIVSADGSLLLV